MSPVPDAMPAGYAIRALSADDVCTHLDAFLVIAGDVAGEYWDEINLLIDLPDKWRLSFALWSNNRPVAYAVLSCKAPDLVHLHHLMVLPELRGKGWGGPPRRRDGITRPWGGLCATDTQSAPCRCPGPRILCSPRLRRDRRRRRLRTPRTRSVSAAERSAR